MENECKRTNEQNRKNRNKPKERREGTHVQHDQHVSPYTPPTDSLPRLLPLWYSPKNPAIASPGKVMSERTKTTPKGKGIGIGRKKERVVEREGVESGDEA
jgi:hypothetical protein